MDEISDVIRHLTAGWPLCVTTWWVCGAVADWFVHVSTVGLLLHCRVTALQCDCTVSVAVSVHRSVMSPCY